MTFVAIRGATRRTFSPIGIELVDDVLTSPVGPTSAPPIGAVRAFLDEDDGVGGFRPTTAKPQITSQAIVTFPGVGRHPRPAVAPAITYRVRIEADVYRPLYLASAAGIQFVAQPWNDEEPATVVPTFARAILLPAFHYQFPSYMPVLRGEVVDPAGDPVANALVVEGVNARALTDERGAFALPLRWTPSGVPISITATDQLLRTGTITVTLPADLEHGQLIAIS
jgi:hypothetical protein